MLLQANMIKTITASGGGDLEARAGESLKIKRIECVPSSNDTYLTLKVDQTTVGYYRVKGKAGNHLASIVSNSIKRNLMEFLDKAGVNVSIPIEEGQKFTVSRYAEAGNVIIIYDRYSAGDILKTMPNGSGSNQYTFVQYAKIGTAPTASGDALIDTSITPKEFPDFPCGKVVPARHMIELLGIVGSPFVLAESADNNFASTFLKLMKDREVLFDTDHNGIPFDGQDAAATTTVYKTNFSLIGSCTPLTLNDHSHTENTAASYTQDATTEDASILFEPSADPLMFNPVLKFESGEELLAYLTLVKNNTCTWVTNTDDVAFILRVNKQ